MKPVVEQSDLLAWMVDNKLMRFCHPVDHGAFAAAYRAEVIGIDTAPGLVDGLSVAEVVEMAVDLELDGVPPVVAGVATRTAAAKDADTRVRGCNPRRGSCSTHRLKVGVN